MKRGVPCEGYARYPTILQWTETGLKKRRRFEEIAPARASPDASDTSTPQDSLIYAGSSPSSSDDDFNTTLFRPPSPSYAILEQMLVKSLETYFPTDGVVISDVKSNWMWQVTDLPSRGTVLASSFAALSLARLGAVNGDRNLVMQGRKQYALALTSLQTALQEPDLAFQDRTLAAIRTLSIYEVRSAPVRR